jgi:hypothetical protein
LLLQLAQFALDAPRVERNVWHVMEHRFPLSEAIRGHYIRHRMQACLSKGEPMQAIAVH